MIGTYRNSIRLRSGRYFDFNDPQPEQFTLRDIAGALSKICRFGGHTDSFYSVAEHLTKCGLQAQRDNLSPAAIRAIFMHDATETFCGDMVRPLKMLLPDYQLVEKKIEFVIEKKFNIRFSDYETLIKQIDNEMLIAEKCLFNCNSSDSVKWYDEDKIRKLDVIFECLPPLRAENKFMRYAELFGVVEQC